MATQDQNIVKKRCGMNTVQQAADRTALSVACWRRWIAERRISYVRLGRAVRITDAEIERVIADGTVAARK
jgi:excisionase family DNA binding protein